MTLAVGEQKYQFEHRDLHSGNVLIAPTKEKFVMYRLNGVSVKLLTQSVKATIIDFTFSRILYDGTVLFDNLERDSDIFKGECSSGDNQFDIYRQMRVRVE